MSLLAASFVDSDTLMVAGDYVADFVVNRKVRASCGGDGYKYTVVSSATFNDPLSTVNLTADSDDLTSNLTGVDWSVVKPGTAGNIPLLHHRDEDTGGLDFGWPTKPCNSKGNSFATVQGAIDDLDGDGWAFVPGGTWSESLVIDENKVTLFGAGWSSIIDGATTGHAIDVSGDDCVVRDLQCMTTAGSGNACNAVKSTGNDIIIENVYVSESDNRGIDLLTGARATIRGCKLISVDARGLSVDQPQSRIEGNQIGVAGTGIGDWGVYLLGSADGSVMTGNVLDTMGNDGIFIHADAENCVVDGNRITNWTNEAIDDDSGTSTIGDNDLT